VAADGSMMAEGRYLPYGGQRWNSETLPTDYRFTGQRYDAQLWTLLHGGKIHEPKAREIYQQGTTPISEEAKSSRGEDWAYSVQTWIYGIYADRSDLTVDRQDYMRQRFPGTSN
jgi:hypothetical protein